MNEGVYGFIKQAAQDAYIRKEALHMRNGKLNIKLSAAQKKALAQILGIGGAAGKKIKRTFGGAAKGVQKLYNRAAKGAKGVYDSAAEGVRGAYDKAAQGVRGAYDKAAEGVKGIYDSAAEGVGGAKGAILDKVYKQLVATPGARITTGRERAARLLKQLGIAGGSGAAAGVGIDELVRALSSED